MARGFDDCIIRRSDARGDGPVVRALFVAATVTINEGKKESTRLGSLLELARSNHRGESGPPLPLLVLLVKQQALEFDGGRTRARTLDPLIKSPTSTLILLDKISNLFQFGSR
jgi:hypothetical protein